LGKKKCPLSHTLSAWGAEKDSEQTASKGGGGVDRAGGELPDRALHKV